MAYVPLNLTTGTLVTQAHLAYIETQYSSVFDASDKAPAGNFYWAAGKNFGYSDGYWTRVGANSAKFWNGVALGTLTAAVGIFDSINFSGGSTLNGATVNILTMSAGQFRSPSGSAVLPTYSFTSAPTTGLYWISDEVDVAVTGVQRYRFRADTFQLLHDSASLQLGSSSDIIAARDAADTLAMKRSTNAQEFRIYNTDDGVGNTQYGGISWKQSANYLMIFTAKAGTGSLRDIWIRPGTGKAVFVGNAGLAYFDASSVYQSSFGTLTSSTPWANVTQTWNSSGSTFKGFTMTITETGAAAASRYFEILGGVSGATDIFYVQKGGGVFANSSFGLLATASVSIPLVGIYHDTETSAMDFAANSTHQARLDSSGNWTHNPAATIGWGTSTPRSSQDLYFSRQAAGIAGLNNDSTHGVTFSVVVDATAKLFDRTGSGNATFQASVIQSGYGSGATLSNGGSVTASTGGAFAWVTKSTILSPTDGEVTLLNNAQNGFTILRFGGVTSSFPALKRVSAGLVARLADDSANCNLTVANLLSSGNISTTAIYFGATGNLTAWSAPSDGVLRVGPNAETTGVRWDYTTDGVAFLKNFAGSDAATIKAFTHTATGSHVTTAGTVTSSAPIYSGTQTWNSSGVQFIGMTLTFVETASNASSRYLQILGGAAGTTDVFGIQKGGGFYTAGDSSIAAAKKFYLDGGSNTYIVEDSADIIGFYANSTELLRLRQSAAIVDVLSADLGIPAAKKLYLDGGSNTYVWESTSDTIQLVAGSGVAMQLTSAAITTTNVAVDGRNFTATFDPNAKIGLDMIVTSDVISGMFCGFRNSGGSFIGSITEDVAFATVSYNTTSDMRLKNDLGQVKTTDVLARTIVHDFTWKKNGFAARGVFAQEAWNVNPAAVTQGTEALDENGNPSSPWAVDYSKYVPDLIVGWQGHEARISALERALDQKGGN